MSLAELYPAVQLLPHPDKIRLLQFLAGELTREEGVPAIAPRTEFPVWSPHNAFSAARELELALRAGAATP